MKKQKYVPRTEEQKQRRREYDKLNPHFARKHHLKSRYGITPEEYNDMASSQNGICGICGGLSSDINVAGHQKKLAIDHCKKTKIIRGPLCTNCNQGMGHFLDNKEILKKAIIYLDNNFSSKKKITIRKVYW